MKKLLVLLLIIGGYLNLTYAYFYNFLSQKHLVAPIHKTKEIIGNNLKSQTIIYVALGDSLTAGVGATDYERSYPYLLAQKLAFKKNIEFVNLAKAGDMSRDVLTEQLPQVSSLKPDLVTLLIGTNDLHNLISLKRFEDNYTEIVSNLKKSGAKIYLLSIPYLGSSKIVYSPYNLILDFRTNQFNNVIKKIAAEMKVEYIDLYSLKKGPNFYSPDQFHPSDFGYEEWAKAINVN